MWCFSPFKPQSVLKYISQVQVVQELVNVIHRMNLYPLDSAIDFPNIYPLDSDLAGW